MRLCIFGDSFVNGTGDAACQGWIGRAVAGLPRQEPGITLYNMGIRRDTSADIVARWRTEAALRLPSGCDPRLAFSFGANDCVLEGGTSRISFEASLANTEAILADARRMAPTIMVGPIPVFDAAADGRIRDLSLAQQNICDRLAVPFLAVHEFVAGCVAWRVEAAAGDGAHPQGSSYAALADFIARWRDFRLGSHAHERYAIAFLQTASS